MRFTITDEAIDRIGLDPALKGVEFAELDKPTVAEILWLESKAKVRVDDEMSPTLRWAFTICLSVRRDPRFRAFSWAMQEQLSPGGDVVSLGDGEDDEDGQGEAENPPVAAE